VCCVGAWKERKKSRKKKLDDEPPIWMGFLLPLPPPSGSR
jgi:hypothetical protein